MKDLSKIYYYCLLIMGFLLPSCSDAKLGELLTIPVDISQNSPLRLSEITEDLIAIELELTNRSLIISDWISRILFSEHYIIVAQAQRVMVFDKNGRFVRNIGRVGQGPGEFNWLLSIAIDEKNNRLFILSAGPGKIISYCLSGDFISEIVLPPPRPFDIHYVDGHFLLTKEQFGRNEDGRRFLHSSLYRLDENFQVIDSLSVRTIYFIDGTGFVTSYHDRNSVVRGLEANYFFKTPVSSIATPQADPILRDTLYRLENNQLIPELRLQFRNDGVDRSGNIFIDIHTIFRSSRYVFSIYNNTISGNTYQFVFDTKTGIGHNMQGGFIDDINNIEERVLVRPRITNSEYFYFWHTHMDPDDFDEPNPTLYLGRLRR